MSQLSRSVVASAPEHFTDQIEWDPLPPKGWGRIQGVPLMATLMVRPHGPRLLVISREIVPQEHPNRRINLVFFCIGPGKHGPDAVKIVDNRGIENLKIVGLPE